MVIFKRAYTTCNFHLHQHRWCSTINIRFLLHTVNQFVKEKIFITKIWHGFLERAPDYSNLMKRTFKYVWMQMKLFTILYLVIKIVILTAVKTEELESCTEYGCPLPPWVTQSPHRINTPYPKETKPSKANEVNSAQGLTQELDPKPPVQTLL